MSHFCIRVLRLLLPLLVTLLVYAPALHFGKVWDDWFLLGAFPEYLDPAAWPRVLARPLPFSDNYFRPLVMFSFVLQTYAGLGDFYSHLINILLHGLNSCVLAAIAYRLMPAAPQRGAIALAAGLLFALHPAMSEAVVWIAGRFDLMATGFMLLAILVDSGASSTRRKAFALGCLFLAALLCKEMAVTLPLILLLLDAGRSGARDWRRLVRRERVIVYAALLAALLAYLAIRHACLGYLLGDSKMALLPLGAPLQRILLSGATFAGYLQTLLLPFADISPFHYSVLPIPLDQVSAWSGLVAMAGLGLALVLLLRRAGEHPALLCLAAALISLLPVLHISPLLMLMANIIKADRAVMLPLALLLLGFAIAAGGITLPRRRAALALCALAWLVLSTAIIRAVLPLWTNDASMWAWTVAEQPECGLCHVGHAQQLLARGRAEEALKEATLALALVAQPWQREAALTEKAAALRALKRSD